MYARFYLEMENLSRQTLIVNVTAESLKLSLIKVL